MCLNNQSNQLSKNMHKLNYKKLKWLKMDDSFEYL